MKQFFGKEIRRIDGTTFFRVDPDFRGMLIILSLFTIFFLGMGKIALAEKLIFSSLPTKQSVGKLIAASEQICSDGEAMLEDIYFNNGKLAIVCYRLEMKREKTIGNVEVASRRKKALSQRRKVEHIDLN